MLEYKQISRDSFESEVTGKLNNPVFPFNCIQIDN